MVEKGYNFITQYLLKDVLNGEALDLTNAFIYECLGRDYYSFQSKEEAFEAMDGFVKSFLEKTDYVDKENIYSYGGVAYRDVNALLRDTWNYEVNGLLTDEIRNERMQLINGIRKAINKAPNVDMNLKTYRGVTLAAFASYGIETLEDLYALKDKFIYEQAFTSTTFIQSQSFFANPPDGFWGNYNVEIECLIPRESDDGIFLADEAINSAPDRCEFLLNNNSLFKVFDVVVDKEKQIAKLKMILIPQKIWNKVDYDMEREGKSYSL